MLTQLIDRLKIAIACRLIDSIKSTTLIPILYQALYERGMVKGWIHESEYLKNLAHIKPNKALQGISVKEITENVVKFRESLKDVANNL